MKSLLLLIILFFTFNSILLADGEDDPLRNWKIFVENFYSKPDFIENKTYLKFDMGLSNFSQLPIIDNSSLSNTYLFEFKYGFIRYNDQIGIDGMFKHARDYCFIGNISSTYDVLSIKGNELNTNTWRWGLGMDNGFGITDNTGKTLILLRHNSAFAWTNIDFDLYQYINNKNIYLERFDEKFKFGGLWSAGLDYHITERIVFSMGYEQSIIYPEFDFLKWGGVFIIDNVLQRTPDFFEPKILAGLGKKWMLTKFLYKNFISYMLYNYRKNHCYAPFVSDKPIMLYSYKIGVTLAL